MAGVAEQIPPFQTGMEMLRRMGFMDIILPFLLVFAVVFAALEKTKIFGEKKAGINSVIAFVVALTVTTAANLVGIIKGFTQYIGILVVFIIIMLMSVTLVMGKGVGELAGKGGAIKWLLLIIVIIGVIIALLFGIYGDALPQVLGSFSDVLSITDISLIVLIIVVVAIVYMMTKK